ncbi:MAG: Trm112 family protein [Spirochaetes bacterium]|nr:Trm112 family protein [Spirochaetota bacterium]MBN2771671.1 Trm112 family protein [Spirochaetota bacterium]
MIDSKLLNILACPACKGDVEYDAKAQSIRCLECALVYPVVDGIPVMLIDKAQKPEKEEGKKEKDVE